MSMQKVVERILSDAQQDAEKTLKNAQDKAEQLLADTRASVQDERKLAEI